MQMSTLAVIDPGTMAMLVGAGLVVVSGWIGWLLGRSSGRRQVARRPGASSGLICSCGHGYGMQEDERPCHAADTAKRTGMPQLDACPSNGYDGPEPLPRAWSP